jgi:hypothetical protein
MVAVIARQATGKFGQTGCGHDVADADADYPPI